MKYFIFSDVHGDFNALMKALEDKEYDYSNPNHQLISLGDNFGRAQTGEKSKGIWKYLISPMHINKPICLRGNHESILLDIFRKGFLSYTDIYNGEDKTISSFAHCSRGQAQFNFEKIQIAAKTGVEQWIMEMPWYFEGKTFICTHGWFPFFVDDRDKMTDKEWDKLTWAETPTLYSTFKDFYPNGYYKKIVVGHWHSSYFWEEQGQKSFDIYEDKQYNVAFIDSCTALSHKVNILIIEE